MLYALRFTVPDRYLVSPPQLARDAPIADILHPVKIGLGPVFREEPDISGPDRLDGRLGQGFHLDKPLQRQIGLYHSIAPVAMADRVLILFLLFQQALIGQASHNLLAAFQPVQSLVFPGVLVHLAVRSQDIDEFQVMLLAHHKVIGVVGRRYLDRARAEILFHYLIGDYLDSSFHYRKKNFSTN